MALVFNAFSLDRRHSRILNHDPLLIVLVIGAATIYVTVISTMTLQRQGK